MHPRILTRARFTRTSTLWWSVTSFFGKNGPKWRVDEHTPCKLRGCFHHPPLLGDWTPHSLTPQNRPLKFPLISAFSILKLNLPVEAWNIHYRPFRAVHQPSRSFNSAPSRHTLRITAYQVKLPYSSTPKPPLSSFHPHNISISFGALPRFWAGTRIFHGMIHAMEVCYIAEIA